MYLKLTQLFNSACHNRNYITGEPPTDFYMKNTARIATSEDNQIKFKLISISDAPDVVVAVEGSIYFVSDGTGASRTVLLDVEFVEIVEFIELAELVMFVAFVGLITVTVLK